MLTYEIYLVLLNVCFLVIVAPCLKAAALNQNETISNKTKDDLSTDFAKQIMLQAKAAEVKSMLNTKIDPCSDFFKYSCGNWHRGNPALLFSNIMTDRFQEFSKGFNRRLTKILKTPNGKDKLENNVKDFYQACLLARHDDVHYKLGLENVYREYGKFPVVEGEEWQDEGINWWKVIATIQNKYGNQILLAVDIMGDIKNNTEDMVYIGTPNFNLVQSSGGLVSVLQEIVLVKSLEKFFGVDSSSAKKTAKEMIDFEKKLIAGGSSSFDHSSLEELLSLKNLTALNDSYGDTINFEEFLATVLGDKPPEIIYFYDEKYIENMLSLLKETPKRVLINYIFWQLIQSYLVEASPSDLPSWCLDKTKKYFGKYIDHIVYKSYKTPAIEAEVLSVWEEIREAFLVELKGDKLDWIANSTREYAIEKLEAMTLVINSHENEDFEKEYGSLPVDRLNYIKNIQEILIKEAKQKFNKDREPGQSLDANEILSFTPTYNILENTIKIPVAILQPRYFWDVNYPQALKYSSLGYLIAHEMIHGFDDDGRNYDKNGNSLNWWDKKSTYEFESRRKCFQAQYHNYKYGGKQLPESVSQSENIADNAGIKLAYKAYKRWLEKQKPTNPEINSKEALPGLDMNNFQLFFTSFAQVWCEDVQNLFKTSVVSSDTHAPGMYRVIGSLSNFQEFSWVFNCPPNAPMDPDYKCFIY